MSSRIEDIPADVIRAAAVQYLSGPEIVALCKTERHFRAAVCDNPKLWEALYRRDLSDARGPDGNYLRNEQDYKRAYSEAFSRKRGERERYAVLHGYEKLAPAALTRMHELPWAVEGGHRDLVERYIRSSPNADELYLAAEVAGKVGRLDLLALLLPLDRPEQLKLQAAKGAAVSGRKDAIAELSAGETPHFLQALPGYLLIGAAAGGQMALLTRALEDGAQTVPDAIIAAAGAGAIPALRRLAQVLPYDESTMLYPYSSAMTRSVLRDQLAAVRTLHEEMGVPVTLSNLREAAAVGSIPIVDYVLRSLYPGPATERSRAAVQGAADMAAMGGQLEMVRHLLRLGAEVTGKLMMYAMVSGNTELLAYLLTIQDWPLEDLEEFLETAAERGREEDLLDTVKFLWPRIQADPDFVTRFRKLQLLFGNHLIAKYVAEEKDQ